MGWRSYSRRMTWWWRALALGGLVVAAVLVRAVDEPVLDGEVVAAGPTSTSTVATTTTVVATTTEPPTTTEAPPAPPPTTVVPRPTTTAAPTTTVPPTTTTTRPHPARVVVPQQWVPYATVGPVTLHHPSDRVEAIGFHQSAQDGAMQQTALPTARRWFVMSSRDRDTVSQGAADIVVEPGRALRAPVTGTVIRAATYTLYCDHKDQVVVIEPDSRPGWQVRLLHLDGVTVSVGQRVEAGVTRIADRARVLPFPSQVEEDTGLPAWPHTHVEVVDPTVKDRPTGPGC